MKNPFSVSSSDVVVRLADWLRHPASPYSLVLGATCGCDISKIGRIVCEYLNDNNLSDIGHYLAFGPDDVRQFAGVPRMRSAILKAASRKGVEVEKGCDYECMVRAIAAIGGVVLSGEWAFETCADMDHVYSVTLSHCHECRPPSSLELDPQFYSADGLARIIAKRFSHWIRDNMEGRKIRIPRSSMLPMLI